MFSQVDTGAVSERKGKGDFAKSLQDFANFRAIMQAERLAAFPRSGEDAFVQLQRRRVTAAFASIVPAVTSDDGWRPDFWAEF